MSYGYSENHMKVVNVRYEDSSLLEVGDCGAVSTGAATRVRDGGRAGVKHRRPPSLEIAAALRCFTSSGCAASKAAAQRCFKTFSTTSALTDWSSVFYSVLYTSLPTIAVGIMDKDLSHKTLLKYPKLYAAGHRQESYNMSLFWITMLDMLWQSLVLFNVPLFTYRNSSIDIWSMGSLWTIAVVILVNMHLAMDIQRWVFITHISLWGSIIVTYGCMVVLDSIPVFPNYGTIYHLAKSPTYWLSILLIVVVGLLPRFVLKVLQQIFWPSDIQIAREAEILRKRRHFFGPKPDQISS
ncbi:Phospholipid-transporting ATPase 1 [Abeliophyllum distichum]|uniref:Phospholipid-transporting ATPase 1 n=1 Tax=Abeliophyllum distichum TaxID=126358 RepID=A0ABD1P3E0_9LAMI